MEILPMLGAVLMGILVLMYFFTPSKQKLKREAEEQCWRERNDADLNQLLSEQKRTNQLLEEMIKKK